jgi:hypothetical protein
MADRLEATPASLRETLRAGEPLCSLAVQWAVKQAAPGRDELPLVRVCSECGSSSKFGFFNDSPDERELIPTADHR